MYSSLQNLCFFCSADSQKNEKHTHTHTHTQTNTQTHTNTHYNMCLQLQMLINTVILQINTPFFYTPSF